MSLQKIQTRIASVKNINQITKAMEVVAATRMRKSQEIALSSRPYTSAVLDLLGTLSQFDGITLPSLLTQREVKKRAIVVVTSDKGLAGAFNSSVLRSFSRYAVENNIDLQDENISFIGVGQKAVNFLEREVHGLSHSFTRFGDYTTLEEVQPLSNVLIDGYLNGEWDEVLMFSTHFKSALSQIVLVSKVLPVDYDHLKALAKEIAPATGKFADMEPEVGFLAEKKSNLEFLIEPSPAEVLDRLSRHLVEMELYHIVLEANASEHAARRSAMKSASDNAKELGEELTLEYNKNRQALVTAQILEIAAGAESLQQNL